MVNSINILTNSPLGAFIAEYLKSNTLYSIQFSDINSFSQGDESTNKEKILLIDITLPGFTECLEENDRLRTFFAVAVFNCKRGDPKCVYSIKHGIKGIFYKDEHPKEIVRGISLLTENKVRVSRRLLFRAVRSHEEGLYRSLMEIRLTPREIEIFSFIRRGYGNREIADRLFISVYTVKKHISNIFTKVGIKTRAEIRDWKLYNQAKDKTDSG